MEELREDDTYTLMKSNDKPAKSGKCLKQKLCKAEVSERIFIDHIKALPTGKPHAQSPGCL